MQNLYPGFYTSRIIVPGLVEVKPGGSIQALAGELLRDVRRAFPSAEAAVRGILSDLDEGPGFVRDDVGAAEMIRVVEASDTG